jgi:hypothetical protein
MRDWSIYQQNAAALQKHRITKAPHAAATSQHPCSCNISVAATVYHDDIGSSLLFSQT